MFEPTSIPKSLKILDDPRILHTKGIKYITPNHYELKALCDALIQETYSDSDIGKCSHEHILFMPRTNA
jgi:pyridoxal/pyridoxine/pyridoxamine kinase